MNVSELNHSVNVVQLEEVRARVPENMIPCVAAMAKRIAMIVFDDVMLSKLKIHV